MVDSITLNQTRIFKEEIDPLDASIICIPNLSIGHSEALCIKMLVACGLISIYHQNRFYCLPSKEGGEEVITVLSERLRQSV
jgi:hypothetical protein